MAHPRPPRYRPPRLDGPELRVYVHRTPPGLTPAERWLACIFLRRYVVWCAKARRFDRLRDAVDLLTEVAALGGSVQAVGESGKDGGKYVSVP